MKSGISLLIVIALAGRADAQRVIHYWDFTSPDDVVGGLTTTVVGPADLSVDPYYLEAYPGAGPSLNNVVGGVSSGSGGYLEAFAVSGGAPLLDLGTESFSFSYWCFDDFVFDQDLRGPRVFDCRAAGLAGLQLGTDDANRWDLRCADGDGIVFNQINAATLRLPADTWVHVACVVDRTAGEVRTYVNGLPRVVVPFVTAITAVPITGRVFATQGLQIGIVDAGPLGDESQNQAIDDLAFYRGVLGPMDIAGLASGSLTPRDFGGPVGTSYCTPTLNSTGTVGAIAATGSDLVSRNDLTLRASGLPPGRFGIFLVGRASGTSTVGAGVLCLSGPIGRYQGPGQVRQVDAMGTFSLAIDLAAIPTPTAFSSASAGETYSFQAWHRDGTPAAPAFNFTDGLSVTFR